MSVRMTICVPTGLLDGRSVVYNGKRNWPIAGVEV